MINRRKTAKFLKELLKRDCLTGQRVYWAEDVSMDPWAKEENGNRVDCMQFLPDNAYTEADPEKGIFICYEIRTCKKDMYSRNLNFCGNENYLVTTMRCYKDILPDLKSGRALGDIGSTDHEAPGDIGIMVSVPYHRTAEEEFRKPTRLNNSKRWRLEIVQHCGRGSRSKSADELVFCMYRSGCQKRLQPQGGKKICFIRFYFTELKNSLKRQIGGLRRKTG